MPLTTTFSFLLIGVGLASAPAVRELAVTDFGADPSGVEDSAPAFRAAFAAAQEHGGAVVLQVPSGRFRLKPLADGDHALSLHGLRDVTLRGSGMDRTVLLVDAPHVGCLRFQHGHNVHVRDLSIDYVTPPYVQGEVLSVSEDGASFVVSVDPVGLAPDAPAFAECEAEWGLVVTPGVQYGPVPVWPGTWEHLQGREWRCVPRPGQSLSHAGIRPGATYVHMARRHSRSAVSSWYGHGMTLTDIRVIHAPALATLWALNEDVVIDGLIVSPPEDGGRVLSTNADGIHCFGQRGLLEIRSCAFSGMADDAINIHSRGAFVTSLPGADLMELNQGGCMEFRAGDRIQVFDPLGDRVRMEAVVRGVTVLEPWRVRLQIDAETGTAGIRAGSAATEADHVYNLSACGAGAVIRDNRFGRHRGRAVLLKSRGVLVAGNRFDNREGWGVALHHLSGWLEGPVASGITLSDNVFDATGSLFAACIDVRPGGNHGAAGLDALVHGIEVHGNRFLNPCRGIAFLRGTDGVRITDTEVVYTTGFEGPRPLIDVADSRGLRVEGLRVRSDSPFPASVVRAGSGVPDGDDGVRIDDVSVSMLEGLDRVSRPSSGLQQ